MWSSIARFCACLSLSALASPVWAQPDLPVDRPAIGLPEALARTVVRNPELAVLGYQIEAAEGRLEQADLRPNPELGVNVQDALGTDAYNGFDSTETTVTLGWVLERGARERLIEAARADVSLRTLDAEIARVDAAAETARRFLDCLAYQGRLQNAMDAVRLAEETVEALRDRVAASRAPEAELSRAHAALARAELIVEDHEHELLSAYHRLSAQWGDTQPDFASVDGELQRILAVEPLEALLARAGRNPEIARYLSEQRLAEAQLRLAEARARPSWIAHAGLRRYELSDDLALVGGITIPLPVRDRNQGRIAEARADIARTQAQSEAARIRLETALFVLYQELRHDTQLAQRLVDDVIPRIEQALADTRRAYELGRYSYLEWSVVQQELLEANDDLLEAGIDARRIVIELERLTGVRFAPPAEEQ